MLWVRCKPERHHIPFVKATWKCECCLLLGVRVHCHLPVTHSKIQSWIPSWATIKWQENNHLAVSRGHPLPSAGDSPHTVLDWRFLGLTAQLKKTRGLTNSFTFPCCMRLVTCRSDSSCFSGEVRRGCCRIGNTLSISILYGTTCVAPKSPSERDNTCW